MPRIAGSETGRQTMWWTVCAPRLTGCSSGPSSLGSQLLTPTWTQLLQELVSGNDTRALSQIDDLYLKVLLKCRLDTPRALSRYYESMGTLLILKRPLNLVAMDRLLGSTHSRFTLKPLTLVIRGFGDDSQPIQSIHQSFREFLTQDHAESFPPQDI